MLWWVALIPLLTGLGVYATGERRRPRLAAIAAAALAATLALALLAAALGGQGTLAWNAALRLSAALTPLSAATAMLVPAVALPVLVFAAVHEAERGLTRLVALLLAFVGAMELLVLADDLLTLLIGWELVGACSWALIGHHWQDGDNPRSGGYAFVTTRLGDLGLFIAAMAAFAGTGSFAFAELAALDGAPLALFAAGIVVSAAAKSGQVPFAPWLFRAMAGPSSVSALLHAATMVAAGAYLLIRLRPVLDAVTWFAPLVMAIGLVTALVGGLAAVLQDHAKRLLAASTSAHYGLMFAAVGAGYPGVALLHLAAHAFFKAQLFLAAGTAGERAGGFQLRGMRTGRALPLIAACTALASLALAGLPPLGAGWTKEAVVTAAGHADALAAIAVIVAGALSAAYAARFQLLAFGARPAVDEEGGASTVAPHRLEAVAIAAMAAVTLLLSALWIPGVRQAVAATLGVVLPQAAPWQAIVSLIAVVAGLYAGWVLARQSPSLGAGGHAGALANWLGLTWLIERLVVRPTLALARGAARLDDIAVDALPRGVAATARGVAATGSRFGELVTDGLPMGAARLVDAGGADARRLHSGLSHHYYAIVAVAALVLIAILMLWS